MLSRASAEGSLKRRQSYRGTDDDPAFVDYKMPEISAKTVAVSTTQSNNNS